MKKNLGLLPLLALTALGHATTLTYHVTQSVGSLSLGQPGIADPYLFLDFQLTDGTNTGNGDSSITVSNLSLTGGAIAYGDRTLPDLGDVSGGSGSSFALRDDSAAYGGLADRAELFRVTSATAVLSYDFTVSTTALDMPTPDGFNVAMLYRTGPGAGDVNVVQTLGPTGNEMVNDVLNGTTGPMAYAVDPLFAATRGAAGDARFLALGVPAITPVPEPTSLAALGLGAIGLLRRRRA